MITQEDMQLSSGAFTHNHIQSMKFMVEELNKIIEKPELTFRGFQDILNVKSTLNAIIDFYMWRMIHLAKQNIIDH